jgi:hypothetical protein
MKREQILERLLRLIGDAETLDAPYTAGEYAGVSPEAKRELTELWGDALLSNTWLVPKQATELDYQDFREWVRMSTGHFLVGYMLARRELSESHPGAGDRDEEGT